MAPRKRRLADGTQWCVCGKAGYASKDTAEAQLLSAKLSRAMGNTKRRERNVYQCEQSHLFHLTSW